MSVDFGSKYVPSRERIFSLLSDLEPHPYFELERVGGNRYCARLLELRRLGYQIETVKRDDHGKSYKLVSLVRGEPQRKQVKVYLDEDDAEMIALGLAIPGGAQAAVVDALGSFRANRERL